jgi:hypothetical protein
MQLMNHVFMEYLDTFIIIFIDDILSDLLQVRARACGILAASAWESP